MVDDDETEPQLSETLEGKALTEVTSPKTRGVKQAKRRADDSRARKHASKKQQRPKSKKLIVHRQH